MDVEHDVDMIGGSESLVKTYIAIDTNILLDHLQVVQALLRILSIHNLGLSIRLLIPLTVLYELDNHHKHGLDHIRHRAREANRFLNRVIKSKPLDHRVPLRAQKLSEMSEYLRVKAAKPDDKHILDCCLIFKETCEEIWLWTKDQIFDTIAESNDIHVLNRSDILGITEAIGISNDPLIRSELGSCEPRLPQTAISAEEETGMEIDEDLYFDLPALVNEKFGPVGFELVPGPDGSRSLLNDYLARYSGAFPVLPNLTTEAPLPALGRSSGFSTPTSVQSGPSRTSSSTPVRLSVYDIHDRLNILLQPLMSHLTVHSPRSDRFLRPLLTRLTELEDTLFPKSSATMDMCEDQKKLLVGIDATRTLARYCERDMYEKGARPRLGDVLEALETLGDMCLSIGLGEDIRRAFYALASRVRDA